MNFRKRSPHVVGLYIRLVSILSIHFDCVTYSHTAISISFRKKNVALSKKYRCSFTLLLSHHGLLSRMATFLLCPQDGRREEVQPRFNCIIKALIDQNFIHSFEITTVNNRNSCSNWLKLLFFKHLLKSPT